MRLKSISLPARPLLAAARISHRLKLQSVLIPLDDKAQVVFDWYRNEYGDKVKLDPSLGQIALLIKGDIYRMIVPSIIGNARLMVNPKSLGHDYCLMFIFPTERRDVNVLDFIHGLTIQRASELTRQELTDIITLCKIGLDSFPIMRGLWGRTFIQEALGDLQSAVENLCCTQPNLGQSKWASLQATEKFLKSYIHKCNGSIKYTHNLSLLRADAVSLGLLNVRGKRSPGHSM